MTIHNEQLDPAPKVQLAVTAPPATVQSQGAFYTKVVNGIAEAFYVDSAGHEVQLTSSGVTTAPVVGEANIASNLGIAGEGVFAQKVGVNLQFKRIVAGQNVGVSTTSQGLQIDFVPPVLPGEANTASNVGAGVGVFYQKVGVNLQMRSLRAGNNITLTVLQTNEIQIDAASSGGGGGGSSATGANLGTSADGLGVYSNTVGGTLNFLRLLAGANISIAASGNGNGLVVSTPSYTHGAAGTSTNGLDLTVPTQGTAFGVKRLKAGTGVSLTDEGTDILVSAIGGGGGSGTITGIQSLGTTADGHDLSAGVSAAFVQMKRLKAGTNVTLTDETNDCKIDVAVPNVPTITLASTGSGGTSLVSGGTGPNLTVKEIVAGTNVTVTDNGSTITIAASGGSGGTSTTLGSTGSGGASLVSGGTGPNLTVKELVAGSNVTVTDNGTTLTIAAAASTATTLGSTGSGTSLVSSGTGPSLTAKSLVAGANVTLTDNGTSVTIAHSSGGASSSLSRYVVQNIAGEEVYVLATGTGITYARSGSTGTFTIPAGVLLISAKLRLPMATIGGTSFTVVYGGAGSSNGSSYTDAFPPNLQVWREDTGAQTAASSNLASTGGQLTVSSLALNQTSQLKLTW